MTQNFYRILRAGAVLSATWVIAPAIMTFGAGRPAAAQMLTAKQESEAAGTYGVEKAHSDISFTVTHMGLTKVHGRFNDFTGTILVDPKKAEASVVNFTIKTASVDTSEPKRDEHLKTKDFFDAATYPDITFKSERITKRKNGYAAMGTLTMHGVSKQVILPFTIMGPVMGMDKKQHLGVSIAFSLKRSDFGMGAYPGMVGDDIDISIDLDLPKQ